MQKKTTANVVVPIVEPNRYGTVFGTNEIGRIETYIVISKFKVDEPMKIIERGQSMIRLGKEGSNANGLNYYNRCVLIHLLCVIEILTNKHNILLELLRLISSSRSSSQLSKIKSTLQPTSLSHISWRC